MKNIRATTLASAVFVVWALSSGVHKAGDEAKHGQKNELGTDASKAQAKSQSTCQGNPWCDKKPPGTKLMPDQRDLVTRYVVKQVIASESLPSAQEIAAATKIQVSDQDIAALRPAFVAALMRDPEGQKLLKRVPCSRFQACSFSRIISSAGPKEFEMSWVREKAEDGRTYSDFRLPALTAHDLAGRTVQSNDLAGRPALVVLMALHCNHSIESLPILKKVADEFRSKGLRVIAVLLNSGGVEDAKYWIPYHRRDYHGEYDVWVASDTLIGDIIGSHLTPTYLLVDQKGQLRKKLVGFKTQEEVQAELSVILDPRNPNLASAL